MTKERPARMARFAALAVVLLVIICRTAYQYAEVIDLLPILRTRPFAAYFRPGLVEAVDWIRDQNPPVVLIAALYDYDRYMYERLGEMLYPIPVKPLKPGRLIGAELCVTPVDRSNPSLGGAALMFENPCLRVFGALP